MKKWARRLLAIIVLVVGGMSMEPILKALIIVPILEALLIDWGDFSWKEDMKKATTPAKD